MKASALGERAGFRLALNQVIQHPRIAIVDLESTCYSEEEQNRYAREVLEVGWVLLDVATLRIPQRRQFYVRPTTGHVSAYCSAITQISSATVQDAPDFGSTMQVLGALHEQHQVSVWGSYGRSDEALLRNQCRVEGLAYPWEGAEYVDIKRMAGNFFPEKKYRRAALTTILNKLNRPFEGRPHCGLDDAYNVARLLAYFLALGPAGSPATQA